MDIKSWKVEELKAELAIRGISLKGLKVKSDYWNKLMADVQSSGRPLGHVNQAVNHSMNQTVNQSVERTNEKGNDVVQQIIELEKLRMERIKADHSQSRFIIIVSVLFICFLLWFLCEPKKQIKLLN